MQDRRHWELLRAACARRHSFASEEVFQSAKHECVGRMVVRTGEAGIYLYLPSDNPMDWRHAMLDGVSLDQLRAFLAAVDEGSFSAAGRRLSRTQSAISEAIGSLETHLGVSLFDRSGRYPRLTQRRRCPRRRCAAGPLRRRWPEGARQRHGRRARGRARRSRSTSSFRSRLWPGRRPNSASSFPRTPLRLYVEALGGVVEPVIDGRAELRHGRTLADVARRARRRAPDPLRLRDGRGSEPPVGAHGRASFRRRNWRGMSSSS